MSAAIATGAVTPASGALVAPGVVGGGLNATASTAAVPSYGGGAAPAIGFAGMFQAVVGLLFVIGLIFACAWIARRLGLNRTAQRGGLVRVVGSTALSPKERVVVVELDDTWLVLGVAPGSVNHLHTLPARAPAGGQHAGTASSQVSQFATDFRQRLAQKLGKPAGGTDTDNRS